MKLSVRAYASKKSDLRSLRRQLDAIEKERAEANRKVDQNTNMLRELITNLEQELRHSDMHLVRNSETSEQLAIATQENQ